MVLDSDMQGSESEILISGSLREGEMLYGRDIASKCSWRSSLLPVLYNWTNGKVDGLTVTKGMGPGGCITFGTATASPLADGSISMQHAMLNGSYSMSLYPRMSRPRT